MSSARGLLGHPAGYTAYCASKSAIDGITKALGCEWGDTGITVNAIAPTVFRSPLTAWMFEDDERAQGDARGLPGARAEGPPRRAGRSRRPAAVPRLGGVGFLHRPHPLRRRRLHGGLTHGRKGAHRRHRRRPDGPRHRAGVRAAPATTSPSTTRHTPNLDTVQERIADQSARSRRRRERPSSACTPVAGHGRRACATPTSWSRRRRKTCR